MTKTAKSLLRMGIAAVAGGLIGALYVHEKTWSLPRAHQEFSAGMKLSVALWCLFSIYWSIASKDSAPTKSAESVWSRQWHLILVNGALLLLIFPVPGLTQRFLPA